ncbi:MAG: amidohydrolase family protein, partial [Gemmatimonadetes bacterium]|nr:amidohydrolase family protein [Gemmatimonadota bacterium]
YQAAAEADAPVYIHLVQPAGEWGEEFNPPDKVEDFPTRLGTLEQVISDFPQLRFNVEHMARPRIDDLLGIMARCPQVWTDVTKLLGDPQLPRYIHTAAEGDFLDRVFWGTDYVGLDAGEWAEWVREGVDFVREGLNRGLSRGGFRQLSASRIDGLLGGNIRRFLGL